MDIFQGLTEDAAGYFVDPKNVENRPSAVRVAACPGRCFVFGPYRLFFFSNEGAEPPNIHSQEGRKLAKFWLNPVVVADSQGFADHELNRVEAIVRDNEAALIEAWHEFFGS